MDDVSDPASGQALMLADKRTSLTVMTTSQSKAARSLAANAECILSIPGFSTEDALLLYKRVWGEVSVEMAGHIQTISELTWGHPMALHSSFHLGTQLGWETLLELLMGAEGAPLSLAEEIYLPLTLAYDQLPTDFQNCFLRMSDLPGCSAHEVATFADLWGVPPAQAIHCLDTLMTDAGVVRSARGKDSQWEVHPQLKSFVRSLLVNS